MGLSNPTQGSSASLPSVSTKTANYTLSTTDGIILANASSGAFTLTLPTAVGVTGQSYQLKRIDNVASNQVTIATTSSQTIDGVSSTTLATLNEEVTLFSDGSNWQISNRHIPSNWVNYTPLFLNLGTVAGPTFVSRRVGDSLEIMGNFQTGTPTSGACYFTIGFGGTNQNVNMDSSKLQGTNYNVVGDAVWGVVTANSLYTLANAGSGQTQTVFFGGQGASSAGITPVSGTFLGGATEFSCYAKVPILGWSN